MTTINYAQFQRAIDDLDALEAQVLRDIRAIRKRLVEAMPDKPATTPDTPSGAVGTDGAVPAGVQKAWQKALDGWYMPGKHDYKLTFADDTLSIVPPTAIAAELWKRNRAGLEKELIKAAGKHLSLRVADPDEGTDPTIPEAPSDPAPAQGETPQEGKQEPDASGKEPEQEQPATAAKVWTKEELQLHLKRHVAWGVTVETRSGTNRFQVKVRSADVEQFQIALRSSISDGPAAARGYKRFYVDCSTWTDETHADRAERESRPRIEDIPGGAAALTATEKSEV